VTVLEVIQRSTEFLARKEVESPRLQAELMLAHILKLPRMQLYLNFERGLDEPQLTEIRELVRRRGQREPLQQILGSACFCGLEIQVDKNVLVPRPETELLAEQGWLFLNERVAATSGGVTALEIGTGSGCIAVALTAKSPRVQVTATDISQEALEVARRNAIALGFSERIRFLQADGLSLPQAAGTWDLVISNPPYIPAGEIGQLQPEVRDFEPRAALDGGEDGLAFYRLLAVGAGSLLGAGGKLMVEFGDGQAESLRKLFEAQNWVVERILHDYTRRPRILIASSHG